jgi:uncharacterized protein
VSGSRLTLERTLSPLLVYFLLVFALAWLLWAAASWATGVAGNGAAALLFLPGTFVPAIVALLLSYRQAGPAGVHALVARIFDWRVGIKWYAFALLYMVVAKLGAAVGFRVMTGDWPVFTDTPIYLLYAAAIFSTPFQAGEEIGWRGYALPRLASRLGLRGAGILLGVIWAAWHVPLFLLPRTDVVGQPFLVFAVAVTALSVAMTWLWWRTGGSLLPVMVMHAAVNNTTGIVPSFPAGETGTPLMAWLTAGVLWAVALLLVFLMPGKAVGALERADSSDYEAS